jgi:hypothetical protein
VSLGAMTYFLLATQDIKGIAAIKKLLGRLDLLINVIGF